MGLAFEAGELDSHQGVPIGLPEIEARLLDDDRFNAYTGWGVGGRVLRFRADAEPFRNKLARQAVLMLVDAERIRRDFGGTFDVAGRLPWQPGSEAFVADLESAPDERRPGGGADAGGAAAGRGRVQGRGSAEDRHAGGASGRAGAGANHSAGSGSLRDRNGDFAARIHGDGDAADDGHV